MKIISLADLLGSLGVSAVKRLLDAFSCRELNEIVGDRPRETRVNGAFHGVERPR